MTRRPAPAGPLVAEKDAWALFETGFGVIDAAGGGVIHFLVGNVALLLALFVSRMHISSEVMVVDLQSAGRVPAAMQMQGTMVLWFGFMVLHYIKAMDSVRADGWSVPSLVCASRAPRRMVPEHLAACLQHPAASRARSCGAGSQRALRNA
jgi:hypothetical protein